MRVLFISSGSFPQGVSPIIKAQGESLIKNGVNVDYFAIKGKGIKGYFFSIFLLRKHLKKQQYDILHAHYGLSAIVVLFSKSKQKIIVSFMGDDIIGEHENDGRINRKSKWISKFNIYIATKFFHHIIVKSEEMSAFFSSKDRLSIIPNGVNMVRFKPMDMKEARNKVNLDLHKKYLLFAANPDRSEKNYNLVRQAASLINKQDNLLVIYGVDQNELALYYNAVDVVLLSSYHEGSPNVIKEAMACNVPIVSTNVGDVKWIIGDEEGCYVVDNDVTVFSEYIQKTLNFDGRTNGRKRIENLGLTENYIAESIIKIYQSI
jgi:teichuronic acid biosynthesis glycosyltransferase TuaC